MPHKVKVTNIHKPNLIKILNLRPKSHFWLCAVSQKNLSLLLITLCTMYVYIMLIAYALLLKYVCTYTVCSFLIIFDFFSIILQRSLEVCLILNQEFGGIQNVSLSIYKRKKSSHLAENGSDTILPNLKMILRHLLKMTDSTNRVFSSFIIRFFSTETLWLASLFSCIRLKIRIE